MSYTNLPNRAKKRAILRQQLDQFATFFWGSGRDNMYDKYGAFIINEKKGSLKFYNGPQFSNQYGKTQWGESNFFTGVSFNTAKIDFTIGLYCFTIAEYQQFLNEFNPYRVDNLRFSFNPNWRYLVKPTQIPSSTREVLGKEGDEYYYYTEIKMTFEIQGLTCARHIDSYEINNIQTADTNLLAFDLRSPEGFTLPLSFLETPVDFSCSLAPSATQTEDVYISLVVKSKTSSESLELFTVSFNPLVLNSYYQDDSVHYLYPINIRYCSEEGILLFSTGGDTEETYLLNLQSAINGYRLVNSVNVNKFMLPGTANFPFINISDDLRFELHFSGFDKDAATNTMSITSFPRTNVI